MTSNEQLLLDAARSGDGRAFGELVRLHDPTMRALAYHVLGSRHAMDDALQDAYLKAHRALSSFRGDASFRTWLYGITYRTCIDHLRADRRRPVEPLDLHGERPATDARSGFTSIDERLRLQAALDELTPEHRAVVLAVDLAGFSYDEVAAQLVIAPGTVASRLNRARAALRAALQDRPTTGEDR